MVCFWLAKHFLGCLISKLIFIYIKYCIFRHKTFYIIEFFNALASCNSHLAILINRILRIFARSAAVLLPPCKIVDHAPH